ncbi:MAG: DAK2 domain-containing protein [Clostridia bacterium]|nr:DAK2 domain-containing protein [Clostridia bacterium]
MIREINGSILVNMFISGANNLINHTKEVDDMNVFPVPDGDTGTNMSMTMKSCVQGLRANENSGVYEIIKSVANDTLRGARGNSGVILSQLMRGMKKAFEGAEVCDVKIWANAFKSASDCAYRAVMKPTEGTILTVAREMAQCAIEYESQVEDIEEFFALVTDAGNKALAKTPELLPKLKQAGVVDSGGQGLMFIVEGMYYYISKNKIIELNSALQEENKASAISEDEEIKFAYCTECIVEKNEKNKSAFKFKAAIEVIGDSMVFVDDDDIVKVHIHTNTPDVVLSEALKVGSLSSVKIENMRLQHSNIVANASLAAPEPKPYKKYAFISVAVGDGIVSTLKELGVDYVIEGGQTMNPSTEDFCKAIESVNAENIFVFPNNKNIIMTAQQASDIFDSNIIVIPTTSVTQALSSMLVFDEDLSPDENAEAFGEAVSASKSAQITHAVRDTVVDDIEIKEGEYLVIVDGKIKASDKELSQAVCDACDNMVDDDSSVVTIFYGEDVSKEDAEAIKEDLEEKYDECDVYLHSGGQPVYHYLISVE